MLLKMLVGRILFQRAEFLSRQCSPWMCILMVVIDRWPSGLIRGPFITSLSPLPAQVFFTCWNMRKSMSSPCPVPTLAQSLPSHGWSLEGKSTSIVPERAILPQSRSTPSPSMEGRSTGTAITVLLLFTCCRFLEIGSWASVQFFCCSIL